MHKQSDVPGALRLQSFPGQYAGMEEFLLKAGYSKEDIPCLIDRTAGRDSKTDFLYEDSHLVEHEWLLKKKGKK